MFYAHPTIAVISGRKERKKLRKKERKMNEKEEKEMKERKEKQRSSAGVPTLKIPRQCEDDAQAKFGMKLHIRLETFRRLQTS